MKRDEVKVGMRVRVRHNGVAEGTVVSEPYGRNRKWGVRKDSTGRVCHVIPEKMSYIGPKGVCTLCGRQAKVLPDGTMSIHNPAEGAHVVCPGSGTKPKADEPAPTPDSERIAREYRDPIEGGHEQEARGWVPGQPCNRCGRDTCTCSFR